MIGKISYVLYRLFDLKSNIIFRLNIIVYFLDQNDVTGGTERQDPTIKT
jgi:hypothetical protein